MRELKNAVLVAATTKAVRVAWQGHEFWLPRSHIIAYPNGDKWKAPSSVARVEHLQVSEWIFDTKSLAALAEKPQDPFASDALPSIEDLECSDEVKVMIQELLGENRKLTDSMTRLQNDLTQARALVKSAQSGQSASDKKVSELNTQLDLSLRRQRQMEVEQMGVEQLKKDLATALTRAQRAEDILASVGLRKTNPEQDTRFTLLEIE